MHLRNKMNVSQKWPKIKPSFYHFQRVHRVHQLQHTEQKQRIQPDVLQSNRDQAWPDCQRKLNWAEQQWMCSLTDGVHVWRQRAQRPALVLLDGLWRVKLWDVIVRVDCDQDVGYKRLTEEKKRRKRNSTLINGSHESMGQIQYVPLFEFPLLVSYISQNPKAARRQIPAFSAH